METSAIAKFEQQDWVKRLMQDKSKQDPKRTHINPNVAFPFQDNFSVGTIHGGNARTDNQDAVATTAATELVEIQDKDDNMSMLTTKTASKGGPDNAVRSRVASGSSPLNGPTADPTQPTAACEGSKDPASAGQTGGAAGGPDGK
jgi:hypothetical protein